MRTLNNPKDAETRFASFRDKILAAGATIDDTVLRRIFAQELAGHRNWSEMLSVLKAKEALESPDSAAGVRRDEAETRQASSIHQTLGFVTRPAGAEQSAFIMKPAADTSDSLHGSSAAYHPLRDWRVRMRRDRSALHIDFEPHDAFPGDDLIFNLSFEIDNEALKIYPAPNYGDNDAVLMLTRAGLIVESTGPSADLRLYAAGQVPTDCTSFGRFDEMSGAAFAKAEDPDRSFEMSARAHGYRYEPFVPSELTDGIVHGPTFDGDVFENETVYTSWRAVCDELGIEPHNPEMTKSWTHPDGQVLPFFDKDGNRIRYASWELRLFDNTVPSTQVGWSESDNDSEALFLAKDAETGLHVLVRRTGEMADRYYLYDPHDHAEIADLIGYVSDIDLIRGSGVWSDFEIEAVFGLTDEPSKA